MREREIYIFKNKRTRRREFIGTRKSRDENKRTQHREFGGARESNENKRTHLREFGSEKILKKKLLTYSWEMS